MRTEEQALSIQSSLESVTKWEDEWQMIFSLDKCKVLHVEKSNIKHQYNMGGISVYNLSEEKDLGITVTDSFNVANGIILQC